MPKAQKLSRKEAIGMLLRWQGLAGAPRYAGPEGVLAFVRQAGCVQFDPLDPCGRNAELVLHARIPDMRKQDLDDLLYGQHALLDHWDKNMSIIAAEDFPKLARRRASLVRELYQHPEIEESKTTVLKTIRKHGPLSSAGLIAKNKPGRINKCQEKFEPLGGKVEGARSGTSPGDSAAGAPQGRSPANPQDLTDRVDWWWAPTSIARATLETLYQGGDLVIHSRSGTTRTFDLPKRHLDPALLRRGDGFRDEVAYYAWRVGRRIRAVGLLWDKASDAWLGIEGMTPAMRTAAFDRLLKRKEIVRLAVEGIDVPLYAPAEALPLLGLLEEAPRTEIIAPLDSLMWDRKLVEALFGFFYRWEVYVPREKRQYGYYVMPVLQGEKLVGRIEIKRDRVRRCLRQIGAWWEQPVEAAGLHDCLDRLCAFDGADSWEVADGI